MNAGDFIAAALDAVEYARDPWRGEPGDYALAPGDVLVLDDVHATVSAVDFVDPACATAAEVATVMLCAGADARVSDYVDCRAGQTRQRQRVESTSTGQVTCVRRPYKGGKQ